MEARQGGVFCERDGDEVDVSPGGQSKHTLCAQDEV